MPNREKPETDDPNELAAEIVKIATQDGDDTPEERPDSDE